MYHTDTKVLSIYNRYQNYADTLRSLYSKPDVHFMLLVQQLWNWPHFLSLTAARWGGKEREEPSGLILLAPHVQVPTGHARVQLLISAAADSGKQ